MNFDLPGKEPVYEMESVDGGVLAREHRHGVAFWGCTPPCTDQRSDLVRWLGPSRLPEGQGELPPGGGWKRQIDGFTQPCPLLLWGFAFTVSVT